MSINEHYPGHTRSLARSGPNMKIFPTSKELWENADEQEKNKNKNVKGRHEVNVTLISELRSRNCDERKYIVSLK